MTNIACSTMQSTATPVTDKRIANALASIAHTLAVGTPRGNITLTVKNHSVTRTIESSQSNEWCGIEFINAEILFELEKNQRLLRFSEAYIDEEINIYGDAGILSELLDNGLLDKGMTLFEKTLYRTYLLLTKVLPYNFKAIKGIDHYDIPAEVYEHFLDSRMQYTCGLFENPSDSLESAQLKKLDFIADQLQVSPGQKHIDIGCGWGGLVNYFSEKHSLLSTGVTNSATQAKYATAKLSNKNALIVQQDFFDHKGSEVYDIATAVGMLEHIPESKHADFFKHLYALLKPGGKAYIQCITKSPKWVGGDGSRFLDKYVYTGYHIEHPEVILKNARRSNLLVELLLDHSKHYAYTTHHWAKNLEDSKEEILSHISERNYRIFFGYIKMAERLFSDGRGQLTRMVFSKPK